MAIMIENCSGCVYYFKRMERLDKGVSVPVEGCVRDNDPDICHEYTEKWHDVIWNSENDDNRDCEEGFFEVDNGFMKKNLTINEYRDWLETKDKLRLAVLRHRLNEETKRLHPDRPEGETPLKID